VPTYVYRCRQCGTTIERRQSFQDAPLTECEACSGSLYRVLQPVQVIFKGSGFYSTDYRAKNPAESEPKPASTDGEAKTPTADANGTSTSTPAKPEPAASSSTKSD
jgi:putative FmdB family regulatory protein